MTRLELSIAARYLRSRRSSRLLSLITLIAGSGVTVGVMALVVVMGVMTGLQNDLREKILVASPHIRILTYGEGLRLEEWRQVVDTLMTDPAVIAAAPFVLSQGLLSAGADYAEGAYVLGIFPDTGTMSVTDLPRHFSSGDLTFAAESSGVDGGIVLGKGLAQRLSAFPGEVITLVSPAGSKFNSAVGAIVPKFWRFEVTGLFDTGMYEYDNSYAVLAFETAQEFAGLGTAASGVDVRVVDAWVAASVGERLEDRLRYPYRAVGWEEQNASLFSALKLEKVAMGLILLLIVIVAAFNIVSTLTMTVTDKMREIGILRAMGLSRRSVQQIFVLQGTAIGLVGTLLGSVLGVLVAWLIDRKQLISLDPSLYFIDHLPVTVEPLDLLAIIAASVTVAVVATIYPAKRAALLNPVNAIRYE